MFSWPFEPTLYRYGQLAARSVSSGFGLRSSPDGVGSTNHKGVDLPADVGTKVLSIGDGTVRKVVQNHATAGTYVEIDHGNGYWSRYLHLSRTDVSNGAKVSQGTPIGLSGGEPGAYGAGSSTGPHLHLEVWNGQPYAGGTAIDPLPLLTDEAIKTGAKIAAVAAAASAAVAAVALIWTFRGRIRARLRPTPALANPKRRRRRRTRRR